LSTFVNNFFPGLYVDTLDLPLVHQNDHFAELHQGETMFKLVDCFLIQFRTQSLPPCTLP